MPKKLFKTGLNRGCIKIKESMYGGYYHIVAQYNDTHWMVEGRDGARFSFRHLYTSCRAAVKAATR
jgi:hypothetical protein